MDPVDQFQRDLLEVLLKMPDFTNAQDYHELARLAGVDWKILQEIDLSGAPRIALQRLLDGVMLAPPPTDGVDAVVRLARFAASSVGTPHNQDIQNLIARWRDLCATLAVVDIWRSDRALTMVTGKQYLLDTGRPGRIPRDLPQKVDGFFGRKHDLTRLVTTLRQGQSVGISALVAGLGGVGKSALAWESLRRLSLDANTFPGGITWVSCDGRTGLVGLAWVYDQIRASWALQLPSEALNGVSTPDGQVEIREQVLRERLSRLPGSALVLLDNVEFDFPLDRVLSHLHPLRITLLVTARHRSSLSSLRVQMLDVLNVVAAVALFAKRYKAKGGKWDSRRDKEATRTVVEALGRLPLAIELAAARAALMQFNLTDFAAEMQLPDVLVRLVDPLREEASVRYSFARSLDLLNQRQKAQFAALGLADGPAWPRPVIEMLLASITDEVSGDQENAAGEVRRRRNKNMISALADLERLTALSLVSLISSSAGARVRVHPLLRLLAIEEWMKQPSRIFLAGVAGLLAGVQGWVDAHNSPDAQAYALLEMDEALVVGALRAGVAHGADPMKTWEPNTIVSFDVETWNKREVNQEVGLGKEIHVVPENVECMTSTLSETNLLRAVVDTAFAFSSYLHYGGHWHMGVDVWKLALRATYALGDLKNAGRIISHLGILMNFLGDSNAAQILYEQSLAISRSINNQWSECANLANLGILARRRGNYVQARSLSEQALVILRQLEDRPREGNTLNNLGNIAYEQGDYIEAHIYYEQALGIRQEVDDQAGEALTLGNLAQLAMTVGDLGLARIYLDIAIPLSHATGRPSNTCFLCILQCELARYERRWEEANHLLDKADALNRLLGSREKKASILAIRARLLRDKGESDENDKMYWRDEARAFFTQARSIYTELGESFQEQKAEAELIALDADYPGDNNEHRYL